MATGLQLPADTSSFAKQRAEGFATPTQDRQPQVATFLPKRVLPVVFLPGIMGSNLRLTSEERQRALGQSNDIAWRPDEIDARNVRAEAMAKARERQMRLDPTVTAVDVYDPQGPPAVSGDERNRNVKFADGFHSVLLADDPPTARNPRSAVQKARQRGWGEVFFGSYGMLLQHLETRLNHTFEAGRLQPDWRDVIGVDPAVWQADATLRQQTLTEDELRKFATGCWFPVHAFGYNWLQSNGDSAKALAARIAAMMDGYRKAGFTCPKVIVVTHSMGGLVARALIHPDYGNLRDRVLGIVHGVMPAIGAAAAYRRMRAGFEDPGALVSPSASVAAKVSGNYGDEVTAVLANAQGGLELLPNAAYGNEWLRVEHNGQLLDAWPKRGDPYEEIYKVTGKWYSLIREEWINPGNLRTSSWIETKRLLNEAKNFHAKIVDTYHPCSYAHYGTDRERLSFGNVVWNVLTDGDVRGWENWQIAEDNRQGNVRLEGMKRRASPLADKSQFAFRSERVGAQIAAPSEPGDQTVPMRSSDHQLRSGNFNAVFRQNGYEHQSSYENANAIACTLYSIVRIAQQADWKAGA